MGIWARMEGSISVKQTSHISVSKVMDEVFEGIEHNGGVCKREFQKSGTWFYQYDIGVTFSADGNYAVKLLNTFLEKVKEKEKDAHFDIELEARFMG